MKISNLNKKANILKHVIQSVIDVLKGYFISCVLAYAAVGWHFIKENRITLLEPSEFHELTAMIFVYIMIFIILLRIIRMVRDNRIKNRSVTIEKKKEVQTMMRKLKKLINPVAVILAAFILSVLICFAQIGLFAVLNGFIMFAQVSPILIIYTALLCFILVVYKYVTGQYGEETHE